MRKFAPVLLFVTLIAGCQPKLNDVGLVTVNPGDMKSRIIEAISMEQKIKVVATPTTGPFNIFIYLEKDRTEAEKDIGIGKKSLKFISFKTQVAEATDLTAVIPANNRTVVTVTSADGRKCVVNLRITN